jgi:NADH dehydrogenase/NADH:ubiquinone oxidoreductase 75 kD subunit (chain G)
MAKLPTLTIHINGRETTVDVGSTVSAAMLAAGIPCRISISGEPRTALCGMGICFECRAVVDGIPHCRTCQLVCRDGMTVETER